MRKVITFALAVLLLLSGCGGEAKAPEPTAMPTAAPTATPEPTTAPTPEPTEEPIIEVDEGVFDVTITIPPELAEGTTQEELDATAEEMNYKSATLNEDGSVTYVMTRAQQRQLLTDLRNTINEEFLAVSESEDYPGIETVVANDDMTEILVSLNTPDLGLEETFAAYIFFYYAQIYQSFNGTNDVVRLAYLDADGGVIYEITSDELA